MRNAVRVDVVLACLSAIVLIAATFGDWYLVRAAITPRSIAVPGFPDVPSLTIEPKADFLRVAVSPWQGDRPLAAGLVILALLCVAAMFVAESGKVKPALASSVVVLAALGTVGIFVVKLASATSASVGMMQVTWSPLTAFYVAAGAAAALLTTSALYLFRSTTPVTAEASSS